MQLSAAYFNVKADSLYSTSNILVLELVLSQVCN